MWPWVIAFLPKLADLSLAFFKWNAERKQNRYAKRRKKMADASRAANEARLNAVEAAPKTQNELDQVLSDGKL